MRSRSVGELLLRPNPIPRIAARPQPASSSLRPIIPSWRTRRPLTTTPFALAAQPHPKEPSLPFNPDDHQPTTSEVQTSQIIDDLFRGLPNTRNLGARSSPSRYNARQRSPFPTSADELAAARSNQNNKPWGASFSMPPPGGVARRKPLNFDEMMGLPDGGDLLAAEKPKPPSTLPREGQPFPRLNPSYGRTVELAPERGRDLVRGINMLGSLMARNKVRADFMKQRFHERPGLRRKRLKSERWRARFKKGFQDVTARVTELTRKGW